MDYAYRYREHYETGDRSPLTRRALEDLVELYKAWGKEEKAAEYRARLEKAT